MGGACGALGKKRHACTDKKGGNLSEIDRWEDLGIDESVVLIIDVKMKCTVRRYIGFSWLQIGKSAGLLCV